MNKWSRPFEERHASAGPARSTVSHHYFAFLSYSHSDQDDADWLHQELERFRVPSTLTGRLTGNGVIPKRLTPIFRDRHDFAAGKDLTTEIREALAVSRCLIVLCSPAAAKSKWVNSEVDQFKRTHPEGCIIAAVVAGEPLASDIPGREDEECFPPALVAKYNRRGKPTGQKTEPLAADLREGKGGRRTGFLKIVAGILGVGLDDLVQRDHLRHQRRLALISSASLAGMIIAGFLAVTAIEARDAARDQRRQAESLVEFMLGDLKDKLEPIGKLDALDGVGSRILEYYSHQDTKELSDEALAQRSQALTLLGRIADARGNRPRAEALFRAAFAGTKEAVERNPDDPQRLFDHAQNVFYLSDSARYRGDLRTAMAGLHEYKRLADRMVTLDPNNLKWRMEQQYADWNLGILFYEQRRFAEAANLFGELRGTVASIAALNPGDAETQRSVPETYAWFADSLMSQGRLPEAISIRERNVAMLDELFRKTRDTSFKQKMIPGNRALGLLYAFVDQRDRALSALKTAVDESDALVRYEPQNATWIEFGYKARFNYAQLLLLNRRVDESDAEIRTACAAAAKLLAKNSREQTWRAGMRDCMMARAQIAMAKHSDGEALALVRQAMALGKITRTSDPVKDKHALAQANRIAGDIQLRMGDGAAARASWATALSTLPNVPERPVEMAERATILERLGKNSDAHTLRAKLQRMGFRQPLLITS